MIYEISAGDIPAIIAAHKRAERMEANSKLGYLKENSFLSDEEVEIVPTLVCVSPKRKLRVSEPRRVESKKAEREEGLIELLEKLFIAQDPKEYVISPKEAKRYSVYKEFQRHNDEIQKIRNERKARELLQFLQYLMK